MSVTESVTLTLDVFKNLRQVALVKLHVEINIDIYIFVLLD